MGRISTRIAVAGALLLILIGGVFLALRGAVTTIDDTNADARRSQQVVNRVNDLTRLATDVESGQRGFVITGDGGFLSPYRRARRELPGQVAEVRELLAPGSPQAGRFSALADDLDAYANGYAERIVSLARRDRATAGRILARGGGQRRVEAIRRASARLQTAERDAATANRRTAEDDAGRGALVGVGAIILAILLVVAFGTMLGRSVLRPVRRVTGAAEDLARGDLTVRVPDDHSAGEVGSLNAAFNEMAVALERTVRELGDERAAARDQATLNRAVLETAHDAFVAMDAEGRIIAWNTRAELMFGWPASLALGRDLAHTIVPPALRAAHRRGLERYTEEGGGRLLNRRLQFNAMHRDGREFPVELTIAPLRTNGSLRFNAFIADGSQRQRAARHRDAQHAVLEVLADDTTLEEGLDGVLAALCASLGWDVAAFWSAHEGGLRCDRVWHGDELGLAAFADASRELVLSPGEELAGRAWMTRESVWVGNVQREPLTRRSAAAGARLQTAICLPVLSDGVPVGALELLDRDSRPRDADLVTTLEGLTAQVGQFVERKRAQAESDRLARDFFALVSHELRTPLTSIMGYLDLVREDGGLTEEGSHFLDVIDRNADRLLHLVGDLLFVATVQAGTFDLKASSVALEEIVAEAVEAATPGAAARGVNLALELAATGCVEGDRVRLAQLLDNLISNAVKFTGGGGDVRVALHCVGSEAVITVADTGMGITDADQAKLFERFFRTSEANEQAIAGVGLGLTISKAIAEGHGGRIEVSSVRDVGTTFTVRLPGLVVGAPARS